MSETKEMLMNAEIALNNRQFEIALSWYKKALIEEPNNLYALSRAGAASVQLKKFDEALDYFTKAIEIDPANGDNHFNLANAYFFNENITKAFDLYIEAERVGCSDDVTLQLNYQLMLICSVRQDIKSALVYMKKCENLDKIGKITLSPDFISEKVKLYMLEQDFDSAEKAVAQLVAIDPASYRNQSIYYSILLVADKYDKAMQVLNDVETFVQLDADEKVTLAAQKATLYLTMAESGKGSREENFRLAEKALEDKLAESTLTSAQRNLLSVTLAEIYYKSEKYDSAIELSEKLLPVTEYVSEDIVIEEPEDNGEQRVSQAQIERELAENIRAIERSGVRLEPERIRGANGNIEYKFREEDLARISRNTASRSNTASVTEETIPELEPMTTEQLEKVYFVLISAYMAKDDYSNASKYASILKHSDNKYYNYFGLYTETLTSRYLLTNTDDIEMNYAKANAYFKNKMLEDYNDSLAALFRVRLYAENGKFERAEELANVLSEGDKKAALNYIRDLREKQ